MNGKELILCRHKRDMKRSLKKFIGDNKGKIKMVWCNCVELDDGREVLFLMDYEVKDPFVTRCITWCDKETEDFVYALQRR